MLFSNVDSWKAQMKRIAKEKGLDVQNVQQRYVLEEFAKKISISRYKEQLIFKGGFVVSTLLGVDTRMTRDLDMTFRSTIYKINDIEEVILEIIRTPSNCFFDYSLLSIETAQENDSYSGFIVFVQASRENTVIKFKLDISNNTLIFPKALSFSLSSLFSEKNIMMMTYSVENIIAEKYETTLDRGEFNTRMRDLFDVYYLLKESEQMIDEDLLSQTILSVSKDRNTMDNLDDFEEIVDFLLNSKVFQTNFLRYRNIQYPNAIVTLEDIFGVYRKINNQVIEYRKRNASIVI